MKVALLFSGQVRYINSKAFNYGLKLFCQNIDPDIYLTYWDSPGISGHHNVKVLTAKASVPDQHGIDRYLKCAFSGFKIKKQAVYSYEKWAISVASSHTRYVDKCNPEFSKLTVNAPSQLFQISESFKNVDNVEKYDLIVRCRFDFVFITPLISDNFRLDEKTVYHINFGGAYFPNRVYDVFFFGHPNSVASLFCAWDNISEYIDSDIDNGLDRRDACRILYLASLRQKIKVVTADYRYGDIYRNAVGYCFELLRSGLTSSCRFNLKITMNILTILAKSVGRKNI
jgi:hypothetical protein